jgi:signal peptide peptidase SppA
MIRSWLHALHVPGFRNPKPLVAVIRLSGVIGERVATFRPGMTAAALMQPLERAFSLAGLSAVALAINSPGGAPVQAALIVKRIRALADRHEVPVIAFCEDVAASGGYMLACAADEIYADDSSVVGSIGVISAGFGFPELLQRIGVERRVYTAGEHKGMLDPFRAEDPQDIAHLKSLQNDVHESFKELVRARRAGKLKADEAELFSGAFWTGRKAVDMGLVDGLGELTQVMRERFGERVRFRPIVGRQSWLRRRFAMRLAMPQRPGVWVGEILATLEERALWGRFGL